MDHNAAGHIDQSVKRPKSQSGYRILKQRVVLEADFSKKCFVGYTEIYLSPFITNMHQIHLNCRCCEVLKVKVNGLETRFCLYPYIEKVVPENSPDLRSFYSHIRGEMDVSNFGELVIDIPSILDHYSHGQEYLQKRKETVEKSYPSYINLPLLIRVEYKVNWTNNGNGILYVEGNEDSNSSSNYPPHLYSNIPSYSTDSNDSLNCNTRMWIPCCDNIGSRYEWEFYITVPRSMKCICSGILVDLLNSIDDDKIIYVYNLPIPTHPSCISITIGPFEFINHNIDFPYLNVCVLPCDRFKSDIEKGYEVLIDVISFYLNFLKIEYPTIMDDLKLPLTLVYVYNLPCKCTSNSNIIYLNSTLLTSNTTVDGEYEFRSLISMEAASLWFGFLINNCIWNDKWIAIGINSYLSSYYISELIGGERGATQRLLHIQYLIDFIQYYEQELKRPLVPVKSAILMDNSFEHCQYITAKSALIVTCLSNQITPDIFTKILKFMITQSYGYINKERIEIDSLLSVLEPEIKVCMNTIKPPNNNLPVDDNYENLDNVVYDPIYNCYYSTIINPQFYKLPYQFVLEEINPLTLVKPSNLDESELLKSDSDFPRLLITHSFLTFIESNSQGRDIVNNFSRQFIFDSGTPILEFSTFYDSKNHKLIFNPKQPTNGDINTLFIGTFSLSIKETSGVYNYSKVGLISESSYASHPGLSDSSNTNMSSSTNDLNISQNGENRMKKPKSETIVKYVLLDPLMTWPRVINKKMLMTRTTDNRQNGQPNYYMWSEQLYNNNDPLTKIEALRCLSRIKQPKVAEELYTFIIDKSQITELRAEAIFCLAAYYYNISPLNASEVEINYYDKIELLSKELFQPFNNNRNNNNNNNNQYSIDIYILQKAYIISLTMIKCKNDNLHPQIISDILLSISEQFIVDDYSINMKPFISILLQSITSVHPPQPDYKRIEIQIVRYLQSYDIDKLYYNEDICSALRCYCILYILGGLCDDSIDIVNISRFLDSLNPPCIRSAAIESYIRLNIWFGYNDIEVAKESLLYVLNFIKNENNFEVKYTALEQLAGVMNVNIYKYPYRRFIDPFYQTFNLKIAKELNKEEGRNDMKSIEIANMMWYLLNEHFKSDCYARRLIYQVYMLFYDYKTPLPLHITPINVDMIPELYHYVRHIYSVYDLSRKWYSDRRRDRTYNGQITIDKINCKVIKNSYGRPARRASSVYSGSTRLSFKKARSVISFRNRKP